MQLSQYTVYNHWANTLLAELMMQIDPSLFSRELKSSFPSLRDTVNHIRGAELVWLERMQGFSRTSFPDFPDAREAVLSELVEGSRKFSAFVQAQDEAFFGQECAYKNLKGDAFRSKNGEIVMHCMNHSTFHRGQLVTMMRELGVEKNIPSTDLITYFRSL